MGIIIVYASLMSALIFGLVGAFILWHKTRTNKWWFFLILLGFVIGAVFGLLAGGAAMWLFFIITL